MTPIKILLVALALGVDGVRCQTSGQSCYGGGSIAAAVILTAIFTLAALTAALYFLNRRRQKLKGTHLILETDPERGTKSDFAFDNPGFKGDATIISTSEKPSKLDTSAKSKWTHWSPLSALATKSEKKRALDDSAIESHEVKVVALKSHDFTGLGFSICGNMKDGIYIKDILHRGPAFESGKLSVGDRINSVTISFEHMVYEDALTILSYASPYEVMIEAKSGRIGAAFQNQSGSPHHPVYRSSSYTDLYHMEKSSKRKLYGDGYSSGSNYSSLQKSRSNVTTLERRESKSPQVKTKKMTPEMLKTHLEEIVMVESAPVDQNLDRSPKIKEQNENNINIERNLVKNIDEVDAENLQPPQPRKREKKSPEPTFERNDSNIKRDKNGIPQEIPDYMLGAANAARMNRNAPPDAEMKKTKGKAPAPPESEMESSKYHSDSDDNMSSVNTIELNSSDITIHQTEDEERKSRKTASTGDLSKPKHKTKTGTLERAQSLDIADTSGSNLVKKKIYDETENLIIDKEPRLSLILDGMNTFQRDRLKKSTEWGNLEDAILNVDEWEPRRKSEPQFNALIDRANQIKLESEASTVINRIWPDEDEIQEVKVLEPEPKKHFFFGGKKSPAKNEEIGYKKRQQMPDDSPEPEPKKYEDNLSKYLEDDAEVTEKFSVKNKASFFEANLNGDAEPKVFSVNFEEVTKNVPEVVHQVPFEPQQSCKLIKDEWEMDESLTNTSPPQSLTFVDDVIDKSETKYNGDAKVATETFLLNEKSQYHDFDDVKVSRLSPENLLVSHVTVTENGGSNLHSLEFTVNEPSELYITAVDDVRVQAQDVVEIVENQFSKMAEDDFKVEITENQFSSLTVDPDEQKTYVTEIQVLTPSRDDGAAVAVSNGDHLESAFENYVKNFESKLETFESNIQNFENNLEEFIREEPRSIIAEEEPSEIEKQVHKIQEIAEEQLKRLPEMRFTTSSYEGGGRKTPEKRHSFELLRSNFENKGGGSDKSPPRKDSTTPPKSRIPISTTMKTPPMSPERRDSRNLENENEKAILELMSASSVHSTPFASKIKPPAKNVTVTSIRNNSKIPSGLPTLSGRPPIAPRKHDEQTAPNGNADSSFKQWVFNPSSNVTNVTVGKDK